MFWLGGHNVRTLGGGQESRTEGKKELKSQNLGVPTSLMSPSPLSYMCLMNKQVLLCKMQSPIIS